MDYTKFTLGEMLSASDDTIKRNAMSVLKQIQKLDAAGKQCPRHLKPVGNCIKCNEIELGPEGKRFSIA